MLLFFFDEHPYLGPYQLTIVTTLVPFVYLVLFVFYPIAYPLSKALDFILGHDEGLTTYNRIELRTMVRIQHEIREKERLEAQKERQDVQKMDAMEYGTFVFSPMVAEGQSSPSQIGNTDSNNNTINNNINNDNNTDMESNRPSALILYKSKDLREQNESRDVKEEREQSMHLEIDMIDSVLKFRDAVVKEAMTEDVFMLSMDDEFSFHVRYIHSFYLFLLVCWFVSLLFVCLLFVCCLFTVCLLFV